MDTFNASYVYSNEKSIQFYVMMELFLNFFNSASHLIDLGHRQDEDTVNNQCQAIEPVVSKRKSIAQRKGYMKAWLVSKG